MTCATAPEIQCMAYGETRLVRVSFAGKLVSGDLLTGTPTIVQDSKTPSTATALTLGDKAVTTAETTINGETVAIAKGVEFTVTAGEADSSYIVKITCSTDGTPAETLLGYVKIEMD